MNTRILNRDFQHPADGWYNIEARGLHPNKRAGIVQVVDDAACQSIAQTFNREAAAPGFPGMLIDIEHFKHDDNKETRAYGWLMKLENRADGIYGQIRWSGTGKKAVDDGDYRFFSTEYDPSGMEVLNKGGKPKQLRPLKLDGLTLTNVNNNKGQKPITNREDMKTPEDETESKGPEAVAASKKANDASENADSPREHEQTAVLHRKAQKLQAQAGNEQTAEHHGEMADMHDNIADRMRNGCQNREFPPGSAGSEHQQPENQNITMKKVLAELGLGADASEESALAEVKKIKNRNADLETQTVEADLETYKNRFDPKQRDFIKSLLVTNRAATLEFLKAQPEKKTAPAPDRLHNRATAEAPAGDSLNDKADDQTAASAIEQGIRDIRVQNREMSYDSARNELRRQKPELFGLKPRGQKAA